MNSFSCYYRNRRPTERAHADSPKRDGPRAELPEEPNQRTPRTTLLIAIVSVFTIEGTTPHDRTVGSTSRRFPPRKVPFSRRTLSRAAVYRRCPRTEGRHASSHGREQSIGETATSVWQSQWEHWPTIAAGARRSPSVHSACQTRRRRASGSESGWVSARSERELRLPVTRTSRLEPSVESTDPSAT